MNLILGESCARGLIDEATRSRLEALARRWKTTAHPLLRTYNLVSRKDYLDVYSSVCRVPTLSIESLTWDPIIGTRFHWDFWLEAQAIPVCDERGGRWIACVDPINLRGELIGISTTALIAEEDWVQLALRCKGEEFLDTAINGLARNHPESSAKTVFTETQLLVIWMLGSLLLAGLVTDLAATLIFITTSLNIFYFVCMAFKTSIILIGSRQNTSFKVTPQQIANLDESTLPIYTVLVPVYKEPAVIPHIVRQLKSLDYPLSRLDVKILLEADDQETIDAFRTAGAPPNFQEIVVPTALPKTKPKACNFGLLLARGDFLTIYDAEDLPEADQLKKVIIAFRNLPPETACVQAALNYFNGDENLLTRMFTLEYSYWFDYLLPGLEALGVPIPLGGTSNHFVTSRLVELGAWDPYNVTEDADLGVRATARGFSISTIDSTTYEEANCAYGNWIRQRSRWIKGYLQTLLVNTRDPARLVRKIGWKAFGGFLLFIGSTPIVFLVNPLLWLLFVLWLSSRAEFFSVLVPGPLLFLAFSNLLLGNFMAIYVCVLAVFKRRNYGLAPYALLNPLYWFMHAVAAYKALWQLIFKPFYWEKTTHGLSKVKAVLPNANVGQ